MPPAAGLWIERLTLTDFRNHQALELGPGAGAGSAPVVLAGPNGAGKTNVLEAVSLLVPGQGLRRAPFADLARKGGSGGWAVAARVQGRQGTVETGTGQAPGEDARRPTGRSVRIGGTPRSPAALGSHLEMVWVTPAMDGLFTGPASERRRFLDRLTLCFDAACQRHAARYERAMRSRNRLLAEGVRDGSRFEGLERIMAEAGVAVAAARIETVAALEAMTIARRDRNPFSPFPWAGTTLSGTLETALATAAAIDVEDMFFRLLRQGRERDRAAGRALTGPHRSDLAVTHGPKDQPARLCSTGEQKALLLGLVLSHADLIAVRRGRAPVLLLDEVAAHLDAARREALFAEILRLGAQAWMTGTHPEPFKSLGGRAFFHEVGGEKPEWRALFPSKALSD